MRVGKSYTLAEFLAWTRRKIYVLLVMAIIPVVLYKVFGQTWIDLPTFMKRQIGRAHV